MSRKTLEDINRALFKVRVPVLATYTEYELDNFGIPLTHDLNNDKSSINSVMDMTTVYLPITRLIDIYSNGYTIMLIEIDKLPFFYNTLSDYLYLIKNNINVGINRKNIMDDRVDYINNFAKEVYENNKRFIDRSVIKELDGFSIGFNLMGYTNTSGVNTTLSTSTLDTGINYISANLPEIDVDINKNDRLRRYRKGNSNVN